MTWTKGRLSKRILDFINIELAHLKPGTINTYKVDLCHFQDFLCETFHTKNFQKEHIAQISKQLLQRYMVHLNKKNLLPFTKLNYLLCVRKYLAWEIDNGYLDADTLEALDRAHLPRVPEYLPKPLSIETDRNLQNLLRHSNHPYAPIFLLLRLTGLRIGELIAMPRDCVLTNAKNEHFLKVPLGKMDNERLVPLNEEALQLIEQVKDSYPLWKRNRSKKKLIGIDGPYPSIHSHMRMQFKKIIGPLTDQGLPVHFHRMRHTYATSLLAAGVSIVSLMKLLGHKRIEMTLRYAKVTPSHLRREYLAAMDAMEEKWNVVPKNTPPESSHLLKPAEMIDNLKAFASKSTTLKPLEKKNLILRLSRLRKTFEDA